MRFRDCAVGLGSDVQHEIGARRKIAVDLAGEIPVCMAGGIGKQEITKRIIKKYLLFEPEITTLNTEPVYGAVAKAKEILTAN